jgi:hypothetical protein
MSQIMDKDFMLPVHKKFEFKTTVEHNGIVLTRPSKKIVKKSRNTHSKIMQAKAVLKSRWRQDEYEDQNENEDDLYLKHDLKKITYSPPKIQLDDINIFQWPKRTKFKKLTYAQMAM